MKYKIYSLHLSGNEQINKFAKDIICHPTWISSVMPFGKIEDKYILLSASKENASIEDVESMIIDLLQQLNKGVSLQFAISEHCKVELEIGRPPILQYFYFPVLGVPINFFIKKNAITLNICYQILQEKH